MLIIPSHCKSLLQHGGLRESLNLLNMEAAFSEAPGLSQ